MSMKNIVFILAVIILASISLTQSAQRDVERRDKIRLIMRAQDLRTIHDSQLMHLLSDDDPIVRERAVIAYGSLQDTSVMSLLVEALTDKDPRIQYAAAFAIGQTAPQLSAESKRNLEHDLIWVRLDKMLELENRKSNAADKLIEEIGKFGSHFALDDLLTRTVGLPAHSRDHVMPYIMSIARFAIRNVVTDNSVLFLSPFLKPPEIIPWQVVYALQRIGDHRLIREELNNIIPLYNSSDPLVRLNLAVLLGKIKNVAGSLEPLAKLAEYDGDWRVRVNALKALGNLDVRQHGEIVDVFRRAFLDGNQYIAITALTSFGNTKLRKEDGSAKIVGTFDLLEDIAKNEQRGYSWQAQGAAASTLAKLEGKSAVPFILPNDYPQRLLQAQLLEACGESGAPVLLEKIIPFTRGGDKVIARSALEALQNLTQNNPKDSIIKQTVYNAAIAALKQHDVAVVTTAASILGDSLFFNSASVDALIDALSSLRIPDDVEAMQEIIGTLGKLKEPRAIPILSKQLAQNDRSVALAAFAAIKSITGKDPDVQLPPRQDPLWTDFDFTFLDNLKDTLCFHHLRQDTICVRLETIRGTIVMELYKNYAPFTVMSFLKLAQRGFYRGLSFHRVVPNFVIQGGDPRGDGWGGPGYEIRSEFSPLTFETGMLGIASAGKDTEGSQFFITQSPQPHLDGRYTIFGKVVSGMDVVNSIQVDDHIFDVKILE